MRKPRFRMDRAGEGALSGRILFWRRFSHGVAMGWKRNAPCGASDLAKIRAAFLNKAERSIHGVPIAHNPENSDTWYDCESPVFQNCFQCRPTPLPAFFARWVHRECSSAVKDAARMAKSPLLEGGRKPPVRERTRASATGPLPRLPPPPSRSRLTQNRRDFQRGSRPTLAGRPVWIRMARPCSADL
jgi:hypothetical protein